jgi:pyruvate formate lyase activating enzyme
MSTVDWPGQLAATVFTRGCPWNCPYCHNPHLLSSEDGQPGQTVRAEADEITWTAILEFLRSRVGLLDGVVFSGGEPCAQGALLGAVLQAREMGFAIGLHTAGSIPARFESLLPHTDWVGFDVKAPFGEYDRITRVPGSGEKALASLRALVRSGVEFEVRTTVHPDLLSRDDLSTLADELESEGVACWAIQGYRPEGVRPDVLAPVVLSPELLPPGLSERFRLTVR